MPDIDKQKDLPERLLELSLRSLDAVLKEDWVSLDRTIQEREELFSGGHCSIPEGILHSIQEIDRQAIQELSRKKAEIKSRIEVLARSRVVESCGTGRKGSGCGFDITV